MVLSAILPVAFRAFWHSITELRQLASRRRSDRSLTSNSEDSRTKRQQLSRPWRHVSAPALRQKSQIDALKSLPKLSHDNPKARPRRTQLSRRRWMNPHAFGPRIRLSRSQSRPPATLDTDACIYRIGGISLQIHHGPTLIHQRY